MSFVIKEEGDHLEDIAMDETTITQDDIEASEMDMEISHIEADIEHEEELATIESEDMQEVLIQTQELDMDKVELAEMKSKSAIVPPLRPLTIAPKPAKMPLQFKPLSAGQQLLLVQGGSSGQQIKLLSSGQGISLSNLQLAKPITVKGNVGTKTAGNTISLVQPKQLVMKKVMTQVPKSAITKSFESKGGQQIVVVQKSEPQMKLVTSSVPTITSTAKTLTLAQAQQMGIISGTKIIPQSGTGGKQIILNKSQTKSIKLLPQIKPPTKILPAPQSQLPTGKVAQRIYIKPSSSAASNTVVPNQIVVAGNQNININTGQLHQINIPGKGLQYIKFITATQADASTSNVVTMQSTKAPTITSKIVPVTSTANVKTGSIILSGPKTISTTAKVTKVTTTSTMRPVSLNMATNTGGNQVVVLPAGYMRSQKIPIPAIRHATPPIKTSPPNSGDAVVPSTPTTSQSPEITMESNGMRPRKPCNCTKSQCLKLYCDCFANGEFCYMCNCMNCYNNLDNEEHRQRAIKNCLERNPNAFRPKIGKARDMGESVIRKHTKGCNCKRSGCLKNYCECYEAKIACSSNCKCLGCRNIEDYMDKKNNRGSGMSESSFSATSPQASRKNSILDPNYSARSKKTPNNKQAFNFITNAVIEATSQCLLTLSNNAEEMEQDEETTKKQIVEEFGRCLKQIIDCSISKNQQQMKVN